MGELSGALREEIEGEMLRRKADLTHRRLGDVEAVFVAEKLRGNTVVEELRLAPGTIGVVGARALAESLSEHNVTLKELFFHAKNVGDDGAQSMAQMLRKNTTLKALHLHVAQPLGAVGARALGEALKESTTLKHLNLGGNGIGDDGANVFAETLRENESLEWLSLWECRLTDVSASSVLSALRESNSTLTRLDLYWNDDIKDATIKESIQTLLDENRALLPASAERRARCLLFCCLKLAPTAHEHIVPSIGAVPVPVIQYAVEHAGLLHVAERFEHGAVVAGQSSAGVRARSSSSSPELQPAAARRR